MNTITAVIEDVKSDTTKSGKAIFKIRIDGQTYTTFDERTAKEAFALKGQKAEAQVEVKQSGEFTNYNLRGVAAPAGIPQADAGGKSEKDGQIARAVALKAAVEFQAGKGSVADVKLAADEFLAWLSGAGAVAAADISRVPKGEVVQPAGLLDEADDLPF